MEAFLHIQNYFLDDRNGKILNFITIKVRVLENTSYQLEKHL
jgi:hypothetical protein